MLRVDAKQGAPKDGNSPLELFHVISLSLASTSRKTVLSSSDYVLVVNSVQIIQIWCLL